MIGQQTGKHPSSELCEMIHSLSYWTLLGIWTHSRVISISARTTHSPILEALKPHTEGKVVWAQQS